jgi:predicted NAD/FAD-dependent oxidoreductase
MTAFPARLDLPFDAAFTESPRLPWLARNNSKPGRDEAEAWVLHASNVWSDGHIDADSQQVIQQLLSEFADLVGGVPEPVTVRAHRWRYALPAQLLGTEYLWDEDLGIGACGDWCGGPRVEGAYLSGLQLGERIAGSSAS